MIENELKSIVCQFLNVQKNSIEISSIEDGLINHTYKIVTPEGGEYILQRLNLAVFPSAKVVQGNIQTVADHLKKIAYKRRILEPIHTFENDLFYESKECQCWRMFSFFENTECHQVAPNGEFVFQAAKALVEFHQAFEHFDANLLQEPIPGFLDFKSRLDSYHRALKEGIQSRIEIAQEEIELISLHEFLLKDYFKIEDELPKRVIHADPKISNFLFYKGTSKVVGIIDWDTLMTGSILYDFGDMIRSYTNTTHEDDISGNNFSESNFEIILDAFLKSGKLQKIERENLILGAQVVILVQAIRFLTDFILGDAYYSTSYSGQNKNRTRNQLQLLQSLIKMNIR